MIKSFASRETENLFNGRSSRRLPGDMQRHAAKKLLVLNAASGLEEMAQVPGNCLEKLQGDRARRYSIRINDQWRVCFAWRDGHAYDVEIVDYHR